MRKAQARSRTRTSAGLECVLQDHSSSGLDYVSCTPSRVDGGPLFRACIVSLSTAGLAPSLCQKKEQALGWLLLTCGRAPSNMCSLVYKIYIIVQNIALDRVVCVCTSAQPHTAPAIAISPHARTTGLNLTRGSYHSDQYGSCTSSCFSTH